MAITKDKGAIKKWGGGELWYATSTDAGSISGSWNTLGYIQESTLNDTTETEDYADETGATVSSRETERVVKLTGLFMQSDKDLMDFLKETVRGNYYAIYQYLGVVNGYHQEALYPICKITPQIELASGVKRIPFEITVLKNEAAITENTFTSLTPVQMSTITISAGQYYAFAQTAVS